MNTSSVGDDIVLVVENVSKRFKLYQEGVLGPIKDALRLWGKAPTYREVLAVTDVSFQLRRGEIVGVVGPNGAGKTTLLKMIAGLLETDSGRIDVRGRVTAVLALGLGIHPDFSGRENIVYSGLMAGWSRAEVDARIEGIIEFSELEDVIDNPFRTYSSGMKARLLFSISMSGDPDILIVDEALATGDGYFVEKCQRRIRAIQDSGATVLFVSHNLYQVSDLTDRSLYINHGRLIFDGPTRDCLDLYIDDIQRETSEKLHHRTLADRNSGACKQVGLGALRILDAWFEIDGYRTNQLVVGKGAELHVEIEADQAMPAATIGVDLISQKTLTTFAFIQLIDLTDPRGWVNGVDLPAGRSAVVLGFDEILIGDGGYSINIEFYSAAADYRYSVDTTWCRYENFLSFHVTFLNKRVFGRGTMCEVPVRRLEVRPAEERPPTIGAARAEY